MSEGAERSDYPREGTEELDRRRDEALRAAAEMYAWTAQHGGIILRRNPLKIKPLKDQEFNRLSRDKYGFRYLDRRGDIRTYYPRADEILARTIDEGEDTGFIVAERVDFIPGVSEISQDQDGCTVLNLWRPPPWKITEISEEPRPFLDHLDYLFDEDEIAVEHVLNFLAHLVQCPAERIGHALLITSEAKGIGKSTLGKIVRDLVGEQNSRVAQTKDLKGQFDGWLVGKLFIQVDEVYEAGNWDLSNRLKPLITEKTVSVNIKYGPQIEVDNYARLMMFSNHDAPLSIEDGDRRYFVFNSKAQPREDDYYDDLNAYISKEEGMTAIYTFLMKRDLSGFNPHRRPPLTQAKQAVIQASTNPLITYIKEAASSGHLFGELGEEFTLDALQRQLQMDGYGNHSKNTRELSEAMKSAGISEMRKTVDGRKLRMWRLPEYALIEQEGEQLDC